MKPQNISLTNKCGSCCHFEPIEGTCSGYCLRNRYGENVVHDPAHPYWQVQRSRLKCVYYNQKPPTNADHIRSMTDEELAEWLENVDCFNCECCVHQMACRFKHDTETVYYEDKYDCRVGRMDWLKQPYREEK